MNNAPIRLLAFLVPALLASCSLRGRKDDRLYEMTSSGATRTFRLHIPAKHPTPAPLLIAMHGGGGEAKSMGTLTAGNLNALADREGFLIAYPNAVDHHWNDGRPDADTESSRTGVDDVAFVSALIDEVDRTAAVDRKRVFATGISNGGMMSLRLACELPHKIAAVASVVGSMSPALAGRCSTQRPVPVMMINGTDDPLVPWAGGQVSLGRRTMGEVIGAMACATNWGKNNRCGASTERWLADADPSDDTKIKAHEWAGCAQGADVILHEVVGGGHTWPGGRQYMPQAIIGRTSRDMDATSTIWDFLRRHPMP